MDVNTIVISKGTHFERGNRVSFLEAAAWVAGEAHSDHPESVCPVIAAFSRTWNDSLATDEERSLFLKPMIHRVLGTRGSPELELERAYMTLDWLVRVQVPGWLHLTESLENHASILYSFPEIRDANRARAAVPVIRAAREAARFTSASSSWLAAWIQADETITKSAASDAAKTTAWMMAGHVAGEAIKAAAGTSARTAVGTTSPAAEVAWDAWDAAREAAWAAAGSSALHAAAAKLGASEGVVRRAAETAATRNLRFTVARLQHSAVDLMHQLIERH